MQCLKAVRQRRPVPEKLSKISEVPQELDERFEKLDPLLQRAGCSAPVLAVLQLLAPDLELQGPRQRTATDNHHPRTGLTTWMRCADLASLYILQILHSAL